MTQIHDGSVPSNLVPALTSFVGREAEMAEVRPCSTTLGSSL
jgi:hypothetical protein